MAGSKNRRFSRFIRQINTDLTVKTTGLVEEARVTTSTVNTQVDSAVAALVSSAPATLNTLDELAAALNDDANFATTITNQIAAKVDSTDVLGLIDSAYVSARTPVVSAGSGFDLTARNNIATGDVVQIASDGTVESIEVASIAADYDLYNSGNLGDTGHTSMDHEPNGAAVAFLRNNTIHIIEDNGSSLSPGTARALPTSHTGMVIAYDPNTSNKLILVSKYDDGGGVNSYITIGTVSGTNITWGTSTEFSTVDPGRMGIVFVPNAAGKAAIHANDEVRMVEIDYIGDSFTFGTAVNFPLNGDTMSAGQIAHQLWDIDIDPQAPANIVTAWGYISGSASVVRVGNGTISGNTISFSGSVPRTITNDTTSSPRTLRNISVTFDKATAGKIAATVTFSSDSRGRGGVSFASATCTDWANCTYTVGSTLRLIDQPNIYNDERNFGQNAKVLSASPAGNEYVIGWQGWENGNGDRCGFTKQVSVIGNVATETASLFHDNHRGAGRTYTNVWSRTQTGYFFYWHNTKFYSGGFTDTDCYVKKAKITTSISNFVANNLLGFAEDSGNAGVIITINGPGSVDGNQTGLTPGTLYYSDTNGVLSTSSTGNAKIGRALTSTSILVSLNI